MEYICRINEIIARARKIPIRIDDLCSQVNIAPSTFHRWRDDKSANPTLRTLNRVLRDMDNILTEHEKRTYEALREKFGEHHD